MECMNNEKRENSKNPITSAITLSWITEIKSKFQPRGASLFSMMSNIACKVIWN
jgi:hypothetical protein